MTTATSGVLARFPLLLPVRTLLRDRVTGPLPSLVLRTEDIWQKRETKVIEVAESQSGFPKKPFSSLMSTGVQCTRPLDRSQRKGTRMTAGQCAAPGHTTGRPACLLSSNPATLRPVTLDLSNPSPNLRGCERVSNPVGTFVTQEYEMQNTV